MELFSGMAEVSKIVLGRFKILISHQLFLATVPVTLLMCFCS